MQQVALVEPQIDPTTPPPIRAQSGWPRLALMSVLLLAAVLNLYRLTAQGYGNTYYAAAVKSMARSWHAFFFVSFDPAGFVSVDKPPLGFWVQTAFARVLGFHGLALLLPQALAAIASVALVYHLSRRVFGAGAGLLAAAAMAVTPVAVAVSRTNNVDSLLVFTLLLATWAVVRAAETGHWWPLLLGAALVGLGFNIKMLQAYLVAPAFGLYYLVAASSSLLRRIGKLAVAGVVLAVVSLSWAVAVDLTPADQRPYIGSSRENSVLDLVFGYNGLQRLEGLQRGGGPPPNGAAPGGADAGNNPRGPLGGFDDGQPAGQPATGGSRPQSPADGFAVPTDRPSDGAPGGPMGGPGGQGENGEKGLLRLFNEQLGGQIAWLLLPAMVGMVAAWGGRPRLRRDGRQQAVVLWGTWLLTGAAFFSIAGFYHRYYLIMLGPPVAVLVGAGATALWARYRAGGWRAALLPAAILATAAVQWHILRDYPEWRDRLTPVLAAGATLLALALVAGRLNAWARAHLHPTLVGAAGAAVLLAAPATWAGITATQAGRLSMLPVAGPAPRGPAGGPVAFRPGNPGAPAGQPGRQRAFAPPGAPSGGAYPSGPGGGAPPVAVVGPAPGGPGADRALLSYLEANRNGAKYLVATPSAMRASPIILATGQAVMAMGGFSGGDPILTEETLAALVKAGQVRFFLLGGFGPGQSSGWVTRTCTVVPASAWQGGRAAQPGAIAGNGRQAQLFGGGEQLYDCAGAA